MPRARAALLLLACLCLVPGTAFAAGIPIRGRVLNSSGAPLAKTRVRLVPLASAHAAGRLELEGREEPEPAASVESGADGSFALEAPQPGMWKIIAGGDRLVPQETSAGPLTGELDVPAVRLQRDAGLAVRVLGPDGRPVAGARVRSEPASFSASSWQNASRVVVTDVDGRAVLPRLENTAVNVRAVASGFGIAERKEVRAKSVELRLPSGPALPLRVLGADGKPAAGVLVQAEGGAPLGMTGEGGLLDLVAPGGATLDVLLIAADGRRLEARVRALEAKAGAKEPPAPRELRLPTVRDAAVRAVSATDSRPIPGALVWLTSDFGGFQRTDARGEARLPASGERSITFQAAAAGFFRTVQESRSAAGKPRPLLTLSLQPDLAITGIVVDETGAPVAGAEITASLGGLQGLPMAARMQAFQVRGAMVRSGPDGRFRWRGLMAGMDVELRVAKDGFAPARVQAAPPSPDRPASPLRVVLGRGRSAFGRVLGPDQQPVAGARMMLRTSVAGDSRTRFRAVLEPESLDTFEAVTKADGRFDFGNLLAGRYDLTARGRGWAPLTVPSLEVPEGNRPIDLGTLVLARGVALEGGVVDTSGRPVEGAEVRLTEASDPEIPGFSEESDETKGLSGADGFFRIEDLRAGSTVDVSVERSGYAPGSAQGVQIPAEQPLRIVLQAAGSISGRVVDPDGKPIAGAMVRVEIQAQAMGLTAFRSMPPFDRSDAEGGFRISNVTPGPLGVIAQAPGWQEGSVANLELRAGEDKRGVEIVLSPAAVLEGRVLSPSGQALTGAQVHVPPGENRGGGFHMTSSDGDGHYVLDSLPPGPRTIEASHPEHGMARRQVELRVGENSLDIPLEGGSEVSGRVVDDAGTGVAGAQVWLGSPGGSPPLSTLSQGDGSFRFAAVADGSYRAGAEKEGFARPERVPVTVDGSSVAGIELRLHRGGAIIGRITGVEVSELSRVQVLARGQGQGMGTGGRIEPDGSYRIEHLQRGEWRVRAELPGTALYAEGVVQLEPGASEARLDLDMERGFELSGRVRRNGAPVADAPIFLEGPKRTLGATDGAGRFRFQGLSAGTYKLLVGDRSTAPSHEETVDLLADREITIDLPAADVTGRVVDAADSSPLNGAAVQLLSPDGGSATGRAQTDSRGVFVVRGVAEGTWRLRAQADGYAPGEASVQVDGTGASEVEVALRATEGVTLQVATAAGLPPRTLFYVVLDGAGQKVGDGTAAVGEGGRARLSRVPPGGWQVLLATESSASTEITVTSPGDAGRLTLPPSCNLRVRVPALTDTPVPATVTLFGPGGRPFRTLVRLGEPTAAFAMRGGTLSLGDVPPGTWEVQVTAGDGRTWRATTTTAPGVKAEAVLE